MPVAPCVENALPVPGTALIDYYARQLNATETSLRKWQAQGLQLPGWAVAQLAQDALRLYAGFQQAIRHTPERAAGGIPVQLVRVLEAVYALVAAQEKSGGVLCGARSLRFAANHTRLEFSLPA
jgi:hypothetical protein